MKNILLAAIVCLFASVASAQVSTNLNATLSGIFNAMTPDQQQATMDTYRSYQRAVKSSPEFKGVTTNLVVTDGITNTVVTTNHPSMSFPIFFNEALKQEKIGRVVDTRNNSLMSEIYSKVGKTVVDGWPD